MNALKTPEAPLALTTLGMVPFLVPAGYMVIERDDPVLLNTVGLWLIAYTAVILSFLGGVRWGIEISQRVKPRWGELIVAVLGALIGWAGVLLYFQYPSEWIFLGGAGALLVHYVIDRISPEMPVWYRRLRIWPTSVAMGCLITAFVLFR